MQVNSTDLRVIPVRGSRILISAILTIGHSTRSLGEFISILKSHGVEKVVDIRTIPRSRKNPQFNRETLPEELEKENIKYVHFSLLGGLRKARPDSINTAWENESFRGFADYMQTRDFAKGIDEVIAMAGEVRLALMCAEALPWRCHRSLVADALVARGIPVDHIMSLKKRNQHTMTRFAKVEAGRVNYP